MADIEVVKFNPQDALAMRPEMDPKLAAINQMFGPAFTGLMNGKPVCSGGVRFGVGDAWVIMAEDIRAKIAGAELTALKKRILEITRGKMDEIIRDHSLWRLTAANERSARFLEAFGFEKKEIYTWEAGGRKTDDGGQTTEK